MDISILGFKLNLEVLILIGIVYLILVMHTVCGCASIFGKREGMDTLTQPFPAPALANETKKKRVLQGRIQITVNLLHIHLRSQLI